LALKRDAMTVLRAEQNPHFAARVADRAAVIEKRRNHGGTASGRGGSVGVSPGVDL
jgi:ABC-type branched-subunit amino acid transport system ATPase component